MTSLEILIHTIRSIGPFLIVVIVVVPALLIVRWLLLGRNFAHEEERRLPRQLIVLGFSAIGFVIAVLALPVPDASRNQILTVFGLFVSGIIAVSSTTLVANAMSGFMLRTTRRFRTGDFIRVGEQFGRVTERGLLHTEIQTEDRELTTLPNHYLITNPVTVVRSSGTLVSVSLSLGYDVHHSRVEPLLIEAAIKAELQEPFVRVLELGNFSVTYRVSGFLADIKNLLTVRSNLCKMVLETLHGHHIEIVSPAFMNQRPMPRDEPVIPAPLVHAPQIADTPAPEEIMFDKAERAEQIDKHRLELQAEIADLENRIAKAEKDERQSLGEELAMRRQQLAESDHPNVEVKTAGNLEPAANREVDTRQV